MIHHGINFPMDRIAAFCQANHIRRLTLFGSILRDNFTPDSDIDIPVEFEPGATPGFGFFGLQEELAEMLDRKVDLNTPNSLSKYFRDDVLREA